MRILVCGGRDYADKAKVMGTLSCFTGELVELAHGAARGADRLAGECAHELGWTVYEFPADWKAHGKAAGPIRNKRMLDEFNPDLVIAFPGGRGTADMVRRSHKAGKCVMEILG